MSEKETSEKETNARIAQEVKLVVGAGRWPFDVTQEQMEADIEKSREAARKRKETQDNG